MLLFSILVKVILPIFAIIGVGVLMDRAFKLDLPTLSKLNFYVFVPALSFVLLLRADITERDLLTVGAFSLVHALLLLVLAWALFALKPLRGQQTVLALGAILYNIGNYGIPFVKLAFGDKLVGIVAIIIVVQNFLSFTLGIWLMERKASGAGRVLAGLAKVPAVHAVVLALALRGVLRHFQVELPEPIMRPLAYLSDGLIPIALLTLGVQLSRTRLTRGLLPLTAVTAMRLIISPLLAAGLVLLFHFSPPISAVLIAGAGFPVAVNLYILAVEYRQNQELAAQSIFLSTLLSAITLSVILALVQ